MYPYYGGNPFALQCPDTWPTPSQVRWLLRAGLQRKIIRVDAPGNLTIFNVIPQEETCLILALVTCRGKVVYNCFELPRSSNGAVEIIVYNGHRYVGTAFKICHNKNFKVIIYNYVMDRNRMV